MKPRRRTFMGRTLHLALASFRTRTQTQLKHRAGFSLTTALQIHGALRTLIFLGLVLTTSFLTTAASAKELTNRMGVGYKNQFAEDIPSVAVQYWPQADLGFSGALGVQTETDNSKFGLMFKLYKVIFPEEAMNFYMGAGAGLISTKIRTVNNNGFEIQGFCGGEFFLPGLDSLGFSFEAGVGIVSLSSGVSFRTIAHSPLNAGMIFYF